GNDSDAAQRWPDAHHVHRQDRRSGRQQDVRMRDDPMTASGDTLLRRALLLALGVFLVTNASAQPSQQAPQASPPATSPSPAVPPSGEPVLEPKAIEILKTSSSRLAPPTIDGMLEAAYHYAATYFPFTDVIVANPYKDIADALELAFYIGQSRAVGGTTTDMVAYATHGVFVQIWIGAEDKLPRRASAVYRNDPLRL